MTERPTPRIAELIRELEKGEGRRKGTFKTGSLSVSVLEADELLKELRELSEAREKLERRDALLREARLWVPSTGSNCESDKLIERIQKELE